MHVRRAPLPSTASAIEVYLGTNASLDIRSVKCTEIQMLLRGVRRNYACMDGLKRVLCDDGTITGRWHQQNHRTYLI
jgi:hypothetical protein